MTKIVDGRCYTHKGWFGLCPVFICSPEDECPDIIARHLLLEPLMTLSDWIFRFCFFVRK